MSLIVKMSQLYYQIRSKQGKLKGKNTSIKTEKTRKQGFYLGDDCGLDRPEEGWDIRKERTLDISEIWAKTKSFY